MALQRFYRCGRLRRYVCAPRLTSRRFILRRAHCRRYRNESGVSASPSFGFTRSRLLLASLKTTPLRRDVLMIYDIRPKHLTSMTALCTIYSIPGHFPPQLLISLLSIGLESIRLASISCDLAEVTSSRQCPVRRKPGSKADKSVPTRVSRI